MESKDCDFIKEMNFVNLASQIVPNVKNFTWLQIQKLKFERSYWI